LVAGSLRQLLIASYNGGSIYLFDPTAAQPWGRAR
jgi:hypothetical protein